MEKKDKSCPRNLFEKICRAFASSPAFQTILRISHRRNHSQSAAPASSVKIIGVPSNPKPDSVPISFDCSGQPPPRNGKPSSATPPELTRKNTTQVVKTASCKEPEAASGNKRNPDAGAKGKLEKLGNSGIHIEDTFTEYIAFTRIKIGNNSNPDEGKNLSGKENESLSENCSRKDKFSDYIDRTKKKLRTTSGFGSFK